MVDLIGPDRVLGPETSKSHGARILNGFYQRFMTGSGVEFGFRGDRSDAQSVLPGCVGVELGDLGYDGVRLGVGGGHFDYVFTSHVFEHLVDPIANLREWYRIVRVGGHIVIIVPHMYLYEKKRERPSRWNEDHKWFFTPGDLLTLVELALEPNSYRVVHLRDNDVGFDYTRGPDVHSGGCYEIELVLKKINKPNWQIA